MDYTNREWLEHEYSPSRWSKKHSQDEIIPHHVELVESISESARKRSRCDMNMPYGLTDKQKLDIFYPASYSEQTDTNLPVFIFIHGGYWQELWKSCYSYIGESFAQHDVIGVVIGYDLAPAVSMETIVQQIRSAVKLVSERFPNSKLFVSGHSAGGHLAMMAAIDNSPLQSQLITGCIPISGIFDLRPLVNTYVNDPLHMTLESCEPLSPQLHLTGHVHAQKTIAGVKFLVIVGGDESNEFNRQSREITDTINRLNYDATTTSTTLRKNGPQAELLIAQDEDHFSILETLKDHTLYEEDIKKKGTGEGEKESEGDFKEFSVIFKECIEFIRRC